MAVGLGQGKSGTATAKRTGGVVVPEGVKLTEIEGLGRRYVFAEGDSKVDMTFYGNPGSTTVSFGVNGRVDRESQNNPNGLAIASRVRSIMKADVASRPDGFQYKTSAITRDGLGYIRTRLYGRAGFSMPQEAGADQYGIVRNGKLRPDRSRAEADYSRRY